jgi:streptogramin lyase
MKTMNKFRKTSHSLLLMAALLAGCQTLAPLSAPRGDRTLTVRLQPTDRQVMVLVRRNMVADIDHYKIELFQDVDGTPTSTGVVHTSSTLQGYTFTFEHLGPGFYTVKATGYDAADTAITSTGEQTIDLTGATVDTAPAVVNLGMSMLNVAYSGTLTLPSGANLPASVKELHVTVRNPGGEIVAGPLVYTRNQAAVIKYLQPNTEYAVSVTAVHDDDAISPERTTFRSYVDGDSPTLEDAVTPALSFASRLTSLETFPLENGDTERIVAIDTDQNVWVAAKNSSLLQRVSSTGSLQTVAHSGSQISDLAADAQGNVWMTSADLDTVTRISPAGTLTSFATGDNPQAVAVDADGNAWVANYSSGDVTRISSTGDLATYSTGGQPEVLAVDGSGNAWVPQNSPWNGSIGKVIRISPTGTLTSFATGNMPRAIAVDGSGNAWVTNMYSSTVVRISSMGAMTTYYTNSYPSTIAIDGSGAAWVGSRDWGSYVTRISASGVRTDFTVGDHPQGSIPGSLAVDGNGGAWVGNRNGNTVVHISSTGSLSTFATTSRPHDLAVDAAGRAWIGSGTELLKYAR